MIRRWPLIPFGRLLAYSMMLVSPTVLALDALVYLRDLDINFAIWVVCGAMVSAIAIAWLFLGDMAEMGLYTRQVALGDVDRLPDLRSTLTRNLAREVAQLDSKWRRRVDAFSQSVNADMEILETLHDPLILVDPERRVVRANAAARELFGRPLAEESIENALHVPELLWTVETALDIKERMTLDIEWPGLFKRYFQARVLPIETSRVVDAVFGSNEATPPLIAVVITLHETTDLRRTAEARERFIANVSHELRTPLSLIIGFIETIQGPAVEDPEAQRRFLQIMYDQATRMARIVSDLLSLSRIEQDEHEMPEAIVRISGLLGDVVAALGLKAAERSIRIVSEVPADLPPIRGDRDQLFQVFQNLVDNALKYGQSGSDIVISATITPQTLVVRVRDHGEGIAPEHIPHLGERFYRIDHARSRATGGSGLGLAIVSRIVTRHRGRLKIDSTPGEGSVFCVELPIADIQEEGKTP